MSTMPAAVTTLRQTVKLLAKPGDSGRVITQRKRRQAELFQRRLRERGVLR